MRVFWIRVIGVPGPQGSKRAVGRTKKGRTILVESSAKVKPWRENVHAAALAAGAGGFGWQAMLGPVVLQVVFTLPAPLSLPKKRESVPAKMPDLSKLVRSTEDALTTAGVWRDDAQVVACLFAKTYPAGTPGAHPDALPVPGAFVRVLEVPAGAWPVWQAACVL